MSGLSSDELAEDYKASLEDLSFNSRYEISNLTVIARENIHAAAAIARTLETHISTTAPSRKLPALYLLDSIAKNVGTPYTIYFQRNLYATFMDAYLHVDPPVRRKLEEMLQTWKLPVPGSTTAQPVFGTEATRKIDNALIKARTAALQQQQKTRDAHAALGLDRPARGTPPPPPLYRNGALPQRNIMSQILANRGGAFGDAPPEFEYGRSNTGTPVGSHGMPVTNGIPNSSRPLQGAPQPSGGLDTLQADISRLIESSQMIIAREPLNLDMQKQLQALLDLRSILQTQKLPDAQLAQVREQVRTLAAARATPPPPPPPPPPVQLPFSTQDLASLLATATQTIPVSLAPQPQQPLSLPIALSAPPPPPPPPPINLGIGGTDPASLFASLQKAGLLPGLSGVPPPPPPSQLPFPLPGNLPAALPVPTPPPIIRSKNDWRTIDVEMKTMSLKIPRPHLIPRLNETLPNKCSSCARRFEDSPKGRQEKDAHLDWHFRVHQRMAESLKRGQNRSWYVDEEDWIHTNDSGEDIASASAETNAGNAHESAAEAANTKSESLRRQYVVVPDASETHRVCPICQEELKYVWHDETEEFVWMDARQVGGRIYHASCHAEASKDRAATPETGSTAGAKRKAEGDDLNPKDTKIKREPI